LREGKANDVALLYIVWTDDVASCAIIQNFVQPTWLIFAGVVAVAGWVLLRASLIC